MNKKFVTIVLLIMITAASRFLPFASNFSAMGAIALFAGAMIANRYLAIAIPLIALFISDFFIGFYGAGMIPVYVGFSLFSVIGIFITNKNNPISIIGSSLLGSILFYLITNCVFVYTADNSLYPHNFSGVMQSYVGALPFFKNSVQSDLLFSGLLFGSYYILSVNVPFLREEKIKS
jgi:hypothetical protein